jgi:hypothetical protein
MKNRAFQLKRFAGLCNSVHEFTTEAPAFQSDLRRYWPHELYIEIGVNTLAKEHQGFRHLHRYYLWSDDVSCGFIRYDDESCLGYQLLQAYRCGWNQQAVNEEAVELLFDITVQKPKGLSFDELLSQMELTPCRTRSRQDFLFQYRSTLIEDLESPNCRLQRRGQNIPNVRYYCYQEEEWVQVSNLSHVLLDLPF